MKGLARFRQLLPSQLGRKGKHASVGRLTTPPPRKPPPMRFGPVQTPGAGYAAKPRGYKRRRKLAMAARRANVKRLRNLRNK